MASARAARGLAGVAAAAGSRARSGRTIVASCGARPAATRSRSSFSRRPGWPGADRRHRRGAGGCSLSLDRGPGGLLRARAERRTATERIWQVLGASRGEGGILGEGVRQALLRDPTYGPALAAAREVLFDERRARGRSRIRRERARELLGATARRPATCARPAARRRAPRITSSPQAVRAVGHDLPGPTCGSATSAACRPTTSCSNFRLVKAALLDPLGDCRGPLSGGSGASSGPTAGAPSYEGELGTPGSPTLFDLVLLGLGPDGHTASMFPDQESLSERTRLVVGVEEAGLEPFVPRVTLTLPALGRRRAGRVPGHRCGEGRRGRGAFGPGAQPDPHVPASTAGAARRGGDRAARRGGGRASMSVRGHRRRSRRHQGGGGAAARRTRLGGVDDRSRPRSTAPTR